MIDAFGLWPVYAVLFMTVAAAVWALLAWWWPDARQRRWQALQAGTAEGGRNPRNWRNRQAWQASLHRLQVAWQAERMRGVRQRLQVLESWVIGPQAAQALSLQLQQAGWRRPGAAELYRLLSLLALLVAGLGVAVLVQARGLPLAGWQSVCLVLLAAWAGLRSPQLVLQWRRRQRQREIFNTFPGALDLMRVCVQSGLGLDAAMDRVGRELRWSGPALSQELHLTGLALRAGAARAEALRQMASRIGLPEVDALVGLLVQSDRFGTPVSDTLRVHAQMLRTQRRQRAQAAAARLPVQLVMPLVFCIFPALLTVLMGPAVLGVLHNLLPSLTAR